MYSNNGCQRFTLTEIFNFSKIVLYIYHKLKSIEEKIRNTKIENIECPIY